jgi:hypothetical protein
VQVSDKPVSDRLRKPWPDRQLMLVEKRVIPTGAFRTSDIEQMRMGIIEHLGIALGPAWLFAAELRLPGKPNTR